MDTHQYESKDDAEEMWHPPKKTTNTEEVEKLHGTIYLVQDNKGKPTLAMFKPHIGRMFSVAELSKILRVLCLEENKFLRENKK